MKNRILSVLLVVAMLVSMIVVPVYANGTATQTSSTNIVPENCPCGCGSYSDITWTELSGLCSAIVGPSTTTDTGIYHYKLTGNFYRTSKAGMFATKSAATIIIDLNGYEMYTQVNNGSTRIPLNIQGGAEVHIIDSSAAGTGKIWSNSDGENANAWGTAILATGNSKVTLWGGTVAKDPLAAADIGSKYTTVYVGSGESTFTIKGGVVEGGDGASMTSAYGGAIHCNGGKVNIEGGVVEGNSAGYGVGAVSGSVITVSGAPTVDNIDLTSGATLNVAGLNGGSVGITAAVGTPFLEGAADKINYITAASNGYEVVVDEDGNLVMEEVEITFDCPHCDAEDVEWVEWTRTATNTVDVTEGHYYLTGPVTINTVEIADDVILNLNGFNVTRNGGRAFNVNEDATFVLFNSSNNESVVAGSSQVVNVLKNATFKAYDCTLKNNSTAASTDNNYTVVGCPSTGVGEEVYLKNCIIQPSAFSVVRGAALRTMSTPTVLENCTVYGGTVSGNGAAIYVSSGNLTINGGSVTDGTATTAGNGIWINNGGTVTVKGGATVGSIDVGSANARVAVEGKVTITDANLTKYGSTTEYAQIIVGALSNDSSIGVTAPADKAFTTSEVDASAYATCFTSNVEGYTVALTSAKRLQLVAPVVDFTAYCHDCDETVVWVPIEIDESPSSSRRIVGVENETVHYYLEGDVSKAGVLRVGYTDDGAATGHDVHIELNGKTIACSNKGLSTLSVIAGNSLHVQNSGTTGGIGANKNAFEMGTGASLSLYGVTVTASSDATSFNGGVCLRGGTDATITATNCVFDASARDNGTYVGTIYVPGGAVATFTGCTIKGCTTTGNGGAMRIVAGGAATLTDCTVIGGTATNGGAISTSGVLTLDDTAIYGGNAISYGKDLRVEEEGTLNIIGDVTCGTQAAMNVSFSANNWDFGQPIAQTTVTSGSVCPMVMDNYYSAGVFADAGKLHVEAGVAVIDGENATWYTDVAAAQAAEGDYLQVCGLSEIALTGDADIDVNGYDITISGNYTVNLFDSENDDYSGFGNVTLNGATLANEAYGTSPSGVKYYTVLSNEGAYSFHVLDMAITSVALATTKGGMYYYATYNCDDTLAANISSYGINYELYDAEGANKIEGTGMLQGYVAGGIADPRTEVPIARINGIIGGVEGYSSVECGMMKIVGTPYVNVNGETVTGESVGKSMKDLCDAMDNLISATEDEALKANYIALFNNMLNVAWKNYDLTAWTFANATVIREDA